MSAEHCSVRGKVGSSCSRAVRLLGFNHCNADTNRSRHPPVTTLPSPKPPLFVDVNVDVSLWSPEGITLKTVEFAQECDGVSAL